MNAEEEHGNLRGVLKEALALRATDLHIDPLMEGYELRIRVDGVLQVLRREESRVQGERLVNQFKAVAGIDPGAIFTPRGVRWKVELEEREVDCRITLVPCISGPKLSIRLLDPRLIMQSVAELGLPEDGLANIRRWLSELNGMFLVSGPAGSGKTTTLYALLHEMTEMNRHVVTIEDPVEYEIDGINQIQVDRRHGLGFVEGLRTILRLDTDHVMIGELRRPTAATAAAAAAIAGPVVMTSLHTRDAVSAITALRNLGILDHQIAAALGVVVNQRLVRKLCPKCRTECALTSVQTEWLRAQDMKPPQSAWRPVGCKHCSSTGFLGRTGLFEVWHLDESDYEMILAGADEESIRDKLRQQHHSTIWDHAIMRIDQGVTCFSEVQRLGLALPWE